MATTTLLRLTCAGSCEGYPSAATLAIMFVAAVIFFVIAVKLPPLVYWYRLDDE
jgi:hypothetical protein